MDQTENSRPSADASATPAATIDFLSGGGEVGARLRALDFRATPLGDPADWPQSLKTIVRVMLDSRYAMWMLWGPELTFFCNDAYFPTVGIKRDWVLGARSDKVWAEIWPDIGPRIRRVLEQGVATWDEGLLLFLERSGFTEETYHTFSYSPVYDDANRIAGMLCVVTEVTERVIGERRLRALRDLAAHTSGAHGAEAGARQLCSVLDDYPFDVPFAALYFFTAGTCAARVAVTRGPAAAVLPEHIALEEAHPDWPIREVLSSEQPQTVTELPQRGIEIVTTQWPDVVQSAMVLPLKGATQQNLAGFLIVGVSPRRPLDEAYRSFLGLIAGQVSSAVAEAQAYEAERKRAESLAELDRAKIAFFSNISHEFRTPLTLMLGPLDEMLSDSRLPAAHRASAHLMKRNAERLRKLVNSLLDFSRTEAGRVQAAYEPTDLAMVTRDLGSNFHSAMSKAGLEYRIDCPPLPAPVYIDSEMWEKIVLNLLSNALKFTFVGSVTLTLTQTAEHAVLEVSDTGVGIPADRLPRLFDRFYRVEGTIGRTHEGSGIGLALVQELVKLHGGAITVTSEPRLGSTFRVSIPLGTAHLPAERVREARSQTQLLHAPAFVQESLRWLDPHDPGDTALTLQSLADVPLEGSDQRFAATFASRILLVDDNADMRGYMSKLLTPYYQVETAADGEQALTLARSTLPDLIVSDVMMPRLDGFGLLATVRADPALRSTPVVLLSARAGEEARIEGLDAGADDYLVKPFSARELLARVGALLELIHMRRTVEETTRRRTEQFETLLKAAPLGVYLVDAELCICDANPAARAVCSQLGEPLGQDLEGILRRLWPPDYVEDVVRGFRQVLTNGEPYVVTERTATRVDSGNTESYTWQINRIPLPNGKLGAVCYFQDISAHVHARTKLEAADRQKDEFLAMLAHELRNPLAPIRNATEVLTRTVSANNHSRLALGIIERQLTSLTRLVNDLLDVSRITQGRIELEHRPLELNDVIAQAVETVEPLLREKRHDITVTIHGTPRVRGDRARLVQCVANLLTNAAKYTDPEGVIRIDCGEDGHETVITISDTGVGIASDLLPRVFDLFVQSDRTLDRAQGGLGIGLSVVKKLIQMHGGRVAARSPGIGAGSTFTLHLPRIEPTPDPRAASESPALPPQRILVVDDNEDAARSLALILHLEGHHVEFAPSAQQGLERARAFTPDVILLDIGLPDVDGYELARRLRTERTLEGVRLVALTGYGQAGDKERARAAGFDAHLTKPAELRTLQQVLAGQLASRC